jgi:uncharacterized protein (DUF952 family)
MLYHITSRDDWAEAEIEKIYQPPTLTTEGFIHLSTDKQLLAAANRFYKGKPDLLVVAINEKHLESDLRYAEADGDSYPHLHGPLNMDAVVEVVALPINAKGEFEVPPEWATWRKNFER